MTWNTEENDRMEMLSVSTLGDEERQTNLNGEMETAYGTKICNFHLMYPGTVEGNQKRALRKVYR